MEELLDAIGGGKPLSALKVILESLKEEGVIDGAVIFYGENFEAEILTDHQRIEGRSLMDIQGIAKSYVYKAIEKRNELFEDDLIIRRGSKSSFFYQISSLYVCPIFNQGEIVGILYVDRLRKEEKFSRAERLWLKFLGLLFQQYLDYRNSEKLIDELYKDLWIGSSEISEKIRKKIRKFAQLSPILILGETGTGKNLLAEMLHRFSRRKGRFVVVSSPNIPESLFEAELFGCKKGAYTGAVERKGLVEEAENGTLFFDEISEIPVTLQSKLLRFIETGFYRKLGEEKERKINTHIICASNKNLEEEVKKGSFRKDLYFRISAYVIEIPPLRERPEDIQEIAKVYVRRNGFKITEEALEFLKGLTFPGNVRELQNLLNRAMVESESRTINEEILREITEEKPKESASLEYIMQRLKQGESFWEVVKKPFMKRELSREQVRKLIKLGLTKAGSYKKLCEIFNIEPEKYHNFMTFLHKHHLIDRKK